MFFFFFLLHVVSPFYLELGRLKTWLGHHFPAWFSGSHEGWLVVEIHEPKNIKIRVMTKNWGEGYIQLK